jgi:hypothetical protein
MGKAHAELPERETDRAPGLMHTSSPTQHLFMQLKHRDDLVSYIVNMPNLM